MADTLEIQQFPLWDHFRARRMPLSFEIEVTARCNLDCRHCYINRPAGDRAAEAGELSVAEIADLADQAVALGAMWCLITGGEPILRPDFPEIYMALKRKGLLLSLFTNATLLAEEHVQLFKRFPPRDIEVTIYGATAETYERVTRRSGAFERFRHGLRLLLDAGVRVRLKAMALQSNLHELPAMAAFGRTYTKDYYRFDPKLHLRLDGDPARNDEIRAERLTPEQVAALDAADGQRLAALRKARCSAMQHAHTGATCDHLLHCGAGHVSFAIGADGTFRLCSSLVAPGTTFDLRRGTLAAAWTEHAAQVRDLRSRDADFLRTCAHCELRDLCQWCPAHAYLETGAMDGMSAYFCAVAHARDVAIGPVPPGP